MIVVGIVLWVICLLAVAAAIAASVIATRTGRSWIALASLVPVGVGLAAAAFGFDPLPKLHATDVALAIAVAVLGVVAGSPLTVYVLDLATREPVRRGAHGGILIRPEGQSEEREVLRGGQTIGHLERAAIIGAIAIGRPEFVAAVIAIKGLGRFSELDSAVARERFIIGTLASMIWAGACGVLAVLTVA